MAKKTDATPSIFDHLKDDDSFDLWGRSGLSTALNKPNRKHRTMSRLPPRVNLLKAVKRRPNEDVKPRLANPPRVGFLMSFVPTKCLMRIFQTTM
ncbi:hypothetical protein [Rahnella sp. ChDrAdgB13]|uniref:hypothetical protein n=1 Tax=Rahnella sp. ChDrAdgB13 TaxID=1850581 RepID=UPI001FCB4D52|nr:hypothetical protein [Rahnella sp. ChDrAdgB13]